MSCDMTAAGDHKHASGATPGRNVLRDRFKANHGEGRAIRIGRTDGLAQAAGAVRGQRRVKARGESPAAANISTTGRPTPVLSTTSGTSGESGGVPSSATTRATIAG